MPSRNISLKWPILLLVFIGASCVFGLLWFIPAIPEVNSGNPVPREGTLTDAAITPNLTDTEYFQLALDIVGQNGWNAEDISLKSIGRTLSCGSNASDLQIWIMLFRWRRVGLRWASDTGFVNLFPYRNEATYYLSESQGSVSDSLFHETGIDLKEFRLDGADALTLTNKDIEKFLPSSWVGICQIGVSNSQESKQPTWEVSYGSTTSDAVIRAKVNAVSGEVSWEESALPK